MTAHSRASCWGYSASHCVAGCFTQLWKLAPRPVTIHIQSTSAGPPPSPPLLPFCLCRLESELAAVEREALVQARTFAEAGLAAERTARLAAEQELGLLAEEMEVGGWVGGWVGGGGLVWGSSCCMDRRRDVLREVVRERECTALWQLAPSAKAWRRPVYVCLPPVIPP